MTPIQATPVFWGETWTLALQALRMNKLRAILTMLGVVIGSACIVLVVTVALAGKRYIISEIEGVGSNLVLAEVVNPGEVRPKILADEITPADMAAIKEGIPQVIQAAGTNDIRVTLSLNGVEHPISLVGVTEGFQQIRHLVILKGRYFDQDDMMTRSKDCVITEKLASTLFPNDDPVGQEVRVGDLHFTVIGVFRERVATFGETEITPETVIIPFSLIKDYTGTTFFKSFYAQAATADEVAPVTQAVREILLSRHRTGAQYHVWNLSSILDAARKISMALTAVLIIIALIALTISGIGIMNIMLVTVTERTREIGIRKAIGAPRDAILYQFLMEAAMISGAGALIGIAIAVAIPAITNFLISFFPVAEGVTVPISWISVVLAFVVSCSTGVVFGYLPANRAARLHPTESLRYE
ncbi:MAG TPA: ABC transporter permease [Candidatus Acidoferrales bacterium]|nr:ABC transporter permease [Candidatus Acidoferrales bacterium]